jgi:hypothetical protein
MSITNEHISGFLFGLGVAGLGFYYYKKNQTQVDAWLREQGIDLPEAVDADYEKMTVEDLVLEKERLEDLIAERESACAKNTRSPVTQEPDEPTEEVDDEDEELEASL